MSIPAPRQPQYVRRYVTVLSCYDPSGMQMPKAVTWQNDRVYAIDRVVDFHPAGGRDRASSDCYTVLIRGQERKLYFERLSPMFRSRVGRWYVLTPE